MIETFSCRQLRMASSCSGANVKLAFSWAHSTALSTLIEGREELAFRQLMRVSAMEVSARCELGSWIRLLSSMPMTSFFSSRDWQEASVLSCEMSRSWAVCSTQSAWGTQVCPWDSSSCNAKSKPPSIRLGLSLAKPTLRAIWSAVLKPMPSISRATR